jgi:uncharacterized DUF497 family protein
VAYPFRWNSWNVEHIAEHGIKPQEAEYVVDHPFRGFPRSIGNDKVLVQGQTAMERYVQVIYIFSPRGVIFVIHARPLNSAEKRRLRRSKR